MKPGTPGLCLAHGAALIAGYVLPVLGLVESARLFRVEPPHVTAHRFVVCLPLITVDIQAFALHKGFPGSEDPSVGYLESLGTIGGVVAISALLAWISSRAARTAATHAALRN